MKRRSLLERGYALFLLVKVKEVTGVIDHRILLNFRVDPEVMQKALPAEFTPKLMKGYAIGGICQVSLSEMRLAGMPAVMGTASLVEYDDGRAFLPGSLCEG